MPNTVRSYRSAAEIGRTELGPRPLPELAEQHASPPLAVADTVLDSGLRVLAVRKAAVPMVELRLLIPFAGNESRHCARAELLAETMLAGTGKRDRIAMDTDLAVIGGDLSTRVDPEYLIVSGSSLADGLPRLLEVLADALTDAAYRADVVDAERDRLVERITVARSQPAVIAREALQRHRYGDHPYAREIPHVEDVAALEGAEIVALHHNSVLARGSTLLLVG
ncbi:MAG: insulinase family protein, partial [Sciscionella sp.]|nr:insulinase family protein [Sciscionella sp.]